MGDRIGYRRVCREMLARFGKTDEMLARIGKTDAVSVLERTAKTCLLTPDAVTDFESVLKLVDFAVKKIGSNPFIRWIQLTKALAEYRAGHVAAAIEWLQRVSPKASGHCLDATAFAVLAMARQRQGQAEEARAAWSRRGPYWRTSYRSSIRDSNSATTGTIGCAVRSSSARQRRC
jgi:hypothetical protein